MTNPFSTAVSIQDGRLVGPWRKPAQMLADQTYGDHASIHDPATAQTLGFRSATIEGPTHFSQFDPLCYDLWDRAWFETGCISAHFRNAAFAGDRLRASLDPSGVRAGLVEIRLENDTGTTILEGTASIGKPAAPTALERRLEALPEVGERRILANLAIGDCSARIPVAIGFDQTMGALYPFTLRDKLANITEPCRWYEETAQESPFGAAIVPFEMVSVLLKYTDETPPFPVPAEVVSLFADQEIRMIRGPVFVGRDYEIEHEVVAFSGSRRTESVWIRTTLFEPGSDQKVAEMLLNTASFRESFKSQA